MIVHAWLYECYYIVKLMAAFRIKLPAVLSLSSYMP